MLYIAIEQCEHLVASVIHIAIQSSLTLEFLSKFYQEKSGRKGFQASDCTRFPGD